MIEVSELNMLWPCIRPLEARVASPPEHLTFGCSVGFDPGFELKEDSEVTVKEVYEKAQGVEATIALLQKLGDTIAVARTPAALMSELHRLDYGFLHKAYDFLQEYADKLYDTSACA